MLSLRRVRDVDLEIDDAPSPGFQRADNHPAVSIDLLIQDALVLGGPGVDERHAARLQPGSTARRQADGRPGRPGAGPDILNRHGHEMPAEGRLEQAVGRHGESRRMNAVGPRRLGDHADPLQVDHEIVEVPVAVRRRDVLGFDRANDHARRWRPGRDGQGVIPQPVVLPTGCAVVVLDLEVPRNLSVAVDVHRVAGCAGQDLRARAGVRGLDPLQKSGVFAADDDPPVSDDLKFSNFIH